MGRHPAAWILIGALLAGPAAAQAPADVLGAIAADAAPDHPSDTPPLQGRPIEAPAEARAVAVEPLGACSLQAGDEWLPREQLTLAQCVDALDASTAPYDARGLRHAYWQGSFLSATQAAIFQSTNGHDWIRLRDRRGP
ncbi:hypothetical protein [Solimonas soli]|uniref:hypothetical protein n=1 Tax=Solimonas soli TaxID=413479 RepID=UPI0004B69EA9|nr:hypothetical protein [Solimonas soli]